MTPVLFTQKLKDNFPTVHDCYIRHFGETTYIDSQSLCNLIIGEVFYKTFTDTIGATEKLNSYFHNRTQTTNIELDFFYKYIENNIDLITFRLL